MGVPLEVSTIVFSVVLGIVFLTWYAFEKTLSIHTIVTTRREAFYWLAILFTFALGTAAGDLSAERLQLGYLVSIFIFGGLIALVTLGYYALRANAVLAFWLAYILTRPLGASIGDFLSQARADGGLGLGPTETSYIFLAAILGLVGYLTVTRKDEIAGLCRHRQFRFSTSNRAANVPIVVVEARGGDLGATGLVLFRLKDGMLAAFGVESRRK